MNVFEFLKIIESVKIFDSEFDIYRVVVLFNIVVNILEDIKIYKVCSKGVY